MSKVFHYICRGVERKIKHEDFTTVYIDLAGSRKVLSLLE